MCTAAYSACSVQCGMHCTALYSAGCSAVGYFVSWGAVQWGIREVSLPVAGRTPAGKEVSGGLLGQGLAVDSGQGTVQWTVDNVQ